MKTKRNNWVCIRCGYNTDGKFTGDICPQCRLPYWKCMACGFTITITSPPATCPVCGRKCDFVNITSYLPNLGGPDKIDHRL